MFNEGILFFFYLLPPTQLYHQHLLSLVTALYHNPYLLLCEWHWTSTAIKLFVSFSTLFNSTLVFAPFILPPMKMMSWHFHGTYWINISVSPSVPARAFLPRYVTCSGLTLMNEWMTGCEKCNNLLIWNGGMAKKCHSYCHDNNVTKLQECIMWVQWEILVLWKDWQREEKLCGIELLTFKFNGWVLYLFALWTEDVIGGGWYWSKW